MYTFILIKNHTSLFKLCEKDWYEGTKVNKILVVEYESPKKEQKYKVTNQTFFFGI